MGLSLFVTTIFPCLELYIIVCKTYIYIRLLIPFCFMVLHHLSGFVFIYNIILTSHLCWMNQSLFCEWLLFNNFGHAAVNLLYLYLGSTITYHALQYLPTGSIRRGPPQDAPFARIIWYISRTIPNLQELSLYLSRISSNYFGDDIYLVHVPLGGFKYFNIHI